jgi:uncharacterized membrane protein (DUF485 family)
MSRALNEKILAHPQYHQLVEVRRKFAGRLTLLAILVVAAHMTIFVYYRAFLTLALPGGVTVEVLMGLAFPCFIILLARALLREGRAFDERLSALIRELR